ncbi:hypothetical protein ONA91_05550 [Micromonospora sp. DR5-3]|uniref:hypothetical protein n=1 Tax=unclassified Micromonospora TaxID=2617518 RepID=UPI0016524991|nr:MULTISPECIES: hypothetical protein [unclassified Micromonospora]MCW3813919.1 hypothetical protein [Micromonospora sp. DR5-3]
MTSRAGVEVTGPVGPRHEQIRTPKALAFLAEPHRAFDPRRRDLLDRRRRAAEPVAVADDFADFRTVPAYERMP